MIKQNSESFFFNSDNSWPCTTHIWYLAAKDNIPNSTINIA